ncbi:MAG: glycosyltransferase [Lacunisphaera sp.]|nr:glycosyltransferase [Lacunisphaera sp.]
MADFIRTLVSTLETSMNSSAKITILQTIVPNYREPLFRGLSQVFAPDFTLCAGERGFFGLINTSPSARDLITPLENKYLNHPLLLWQKNLPPAAYDADVLVAEFCLRSVSTWRLLAARRRRGLPTILWGHTSGEHEASKVIGNWMLRQASGFITYTNSEADELRKRFTGKPVIAAPNAVMFAQDCSFLPAPGDEVADILYSGRLIADKKLGLMLHGWRLALEQSLVPANARLILIGEGPENERLRAIARQSPLTRDRVHFAGIITETARLREKYRTCLATCSPGYVGLAAIQSICFGVPVVVADKEPHSPEIEACREGETALLFRAGDPQDLAVKFGTLFKERRAWLERRPAITAFARKNYTLDAMISSFREIISRCANPRT